MRGGTYIAVEGIDGAGKSRLVQELARYWQDRREVLVVREPHLPGTKTLFRRGLPPLAEFHLFNADRHALFRGIVNPALRRGALVLADRSFLSSLAYQVPFLAMGKERALELCLEATEGTRPDLWFLLDLPVEAAWERTRKRPQWEEAFLLERLAEVRRRYLEMASSDPQAVVLDAHLPPKELLRRALSILKSRGLAGSG